MTKLFRISGYLLSKNCKDDAESLRKYFNGRISDIEDDMGILLDDEKWQQLYIEESEPFTLDGEDKDDCDLALLSRHFNHTSKENEFDRPLPQKGEVYKHFKLGKLVTVLGISRHTETEEVTVVYEYEGNIWNRPLEMFMSEVDKEKYPNATQKYRFDKIKKIEKVYNFEV